MIFCFIFITSSAQPGRNEISVGISGGISALHYSVSEGKFKPQGGASLNLGYLLKITDLWGNRYRYRIISIPIKSQH